MKIEIFESEEEEMLSILDEHGDILFYGNYYDFEIGGKNFKKMFEKMGHEVKLKNEKFFE
jgi:hypothetical protein